MIKLHSAATAAAEHRLHEVHKCERYDALSTCFKFIYSCVIPQRYILRKIITNYKNAFFYRNSLDGVMT